MKALLKIIKNKNNIHHLRSIYFGSLLLSLLLSTPLFAQTPAYIHYTLEDGLPSMQVYNILQDSKGYIWIATSLGVCQFDGTTFHTYTTAQGLPNNNILYLEEDPDQAIWIQTAQGQTARIQGEEVEVKATSIFGDRTVRSGDIAIDYAQSLLYFRDSLEQQLLPKQKSYFKQPISCRFDEDTRHIWLGTWGGGAFYCRNFQTDSLVVASYLADKTITDIQVDSEGNTWFATLGEGVYLLTNRYVRSYTVNNGLAHNEIHSLQIDKKGHIWAGSSKGTLAHIGSDTLINHDVGSGFNAYNRIHDIYLDDQENQWLSMDEGLLVRKPASQKQFLVYLNACKKVIPSTKDRYWIATYTQPVELDIFQGVEVNRIPVQQINSLCEAGTAALWLATNNGLYYYANDTAFYWGKKENILSKRINELTLDKEGRLWMAMDGYGVVVKKGKLLLQIHTEHGLPSDICQAIHVADNGTVWVATNKGLGKIQLNEMEPASLSIHTYTYLDGLASNHVNDVLVENEQVWVATHKGLSVFKEGELNTKRLPPPIYLKGLQIQNEDTTLQKKYVLDYDQNNLKIHYIGLSYKTDGNIRYYYQMEGVDTTWQTTTASSMQYSTLAPGDYTFRVKAIDKAGVMSKQTASVQFHIHQPYWERTWYQVLLGVLALGVISLLAYLIIQYFKNRNEIRRRLVESEQMALRAQMNPHFIFNSLNSIQYFITENDKKSANLYLSTFSTLIRKVLDHSSQSFISLEDELEYLHLYLSIEALRFRDKFNYQIKVPNTIDIDEIMIPPMLIQPYIENAIQHGLLQKKVGERELLIEFDLKEEELLICTVADNGIGRAKAQALKAGRPRNEHQGIGTTNPKARLEILNQLHKAKIQVHFTDLKDTDGTANGTKVEINIPVFYG